MFRGVATALITPFTENGVDFEAYGRLIEFQIENGINALLVLGTTGEPPTMTSEEKSAVIKFAIEKINKRVPVIVGTGSNCTAKAVTNSIEAEQLGADILLVVTPYYNKCTQDGLIAHYNAIADAVNIPIITYNVPPRTGVNILPSTCAKLAKNPKFIAIKEACGKIEQITQTASEIKNSTMELFSGDDGLIIPIMKLGASGLISVASNVIPKETVKIVHACLDGDFENAQVLFDKYSEFMEGLFFETNPIPVKYAASKLGLCQNILRLPLTPMSSENSLRLDALMKKIDLI